MMIPQGIHLLGGVKTRVGWGKLAIFKIKASISRKRLRDTSKVTISANSKVHVLSIGTKIDDIGW